MNNISPVKTGLFYGLISGLGCFAIFILLFLWNKNAFGNWSWLASWVPILLMVLGTKAHRDKDLEGFIPYGRALGASMLIAASGAMVYAILAFSFTTFFGGSLITLHIEDSAEKLAMTKGLFNENMYEKASIALEEMRNNHTRALVQIVQADFLWKIVGGFLISLIVAAAIKKNKPFVEEPTDGQL